MMKTMTSGTLLKSPAAIPNTRKSTTINNKGLTANHPRRVDTRGIEENCVIRERIVFVCGCEVTISPAHDQAREWGECFCFLQKGNVPLLIYMPTPLTKNTVTVVR